ncbi:hypothetical protein BDV39DRAFT_168017, partial [Aspergillus sergii]
AHVGERAQQGAPGGKAQKNKIKTPNARDARLLGHPWKCYFRFSCLVRGRGYPYGHSHCQAKFHMDGMRGVSKVNS